MELESLKLLCGEYGGADGQWQTMPSPTKGECNREKRVGYGDEIICDLQSELLSSEREQCLRQTDMLVGELTPLMEDRNFLRRQDQGVRGQGG